MQVLKVRLKKICKIKSPDLLFFVVFISFYISRYHFSQIFRTSFCIIRKKDFRQEFSTDSLKPSYPLNSQNLLSIMKVFCQCSLTFIKIATVLYYAGEQPLLKIAYHIIFIINELHLLRFLGCQTSGTSDK